MTRVGWLMPGGVSAEVGGVECGLRTRLWARLLCKAVGLLPLIAAAGQAKPSLPAKPKSSPLGGLSELKGLYKVRCCGAQLEV